MIDELVHRSADATGLTPDQTRTALSAALFLIRKHGDAAKVSDLFGQVDGAGELADQGEALAGTSKGGVMSSLLRVGGGAGGAAMSDAMALSPKLARLGINVGDMQKILPVAMDWVRDKTGQDKLRDVLGTIPGLGALMTGQG